MTFTFTMDAFPDYTKFDKSHKVLAAIQVIYGEENSEEEESRKCGTTFNQTATSSAAGATVKVTSNSDTSCEISVTGSSVSDNVQEDPVFNDNDELLGVKGMSVEFPLQIPSDGRYHIKQTNPSLEYYYGTDNRVTQSGTDYVKNADYDLVKGDTLSVLVTDKNKSKNIRVELSLNGNVIKTYNITANVQFA